MIGESVVTRTERSGEKTQQHSFRFDRNQRTKSFPLTPFSIQSTLLIASRSGSQSFLAARNGFGFCAFVYNTITSGKPR